MISKVPQSQIELNNNIHLSIHAYAYTYITEYSIIRKDNSYITLTNHKHTSDG